MPLAVPEHADVAGAVGAAAGAVRQRVMISITQPVEGKFRLHLPQGPVDKASLDDALAAARLAARTLAETRAARAGAGNISVETAEDINQVTLGGGKDLFIEARVYATASGRPA